MDVGVDSWRFFGALGIVFLNFAALETGLKIAGLSGWIWMQNPPGGGKSCGILAL